MLGKWHFGDQGSQAQSPKQQGVTVSIPATAPSTETFPPCQQLHSKASFSVIKSVLLLCTSKIQGQEAREGFGWQREGNRRSLAGKGVTGKRILAGRGVTVEGLWWQICRLEKRSQNATLVSSALPASQAPSQAKPPPFRPLASHPTPVSERAQLLPLSFPFCPRITPRAPSKRSGAATRAGRGPSPPPAQGLRGRAGPPRAVPPPRAAFPRPPPPAGEAGPSPRPAAIG